MARFEEKFQKEKGFILIRHFAPSARNDVSRAYLRFCMFDSAASGWVGRFSESGWWESGLEGWVRFRTENIHARS